MERKRKLIILIVLYSAFILGSISSYDSDSSAGMNRTHSNISIHSIQGAGHKSPIAGCSVSGIQGIVCLNTSYGFYMQDLYPDNDIRTSEGILVYTKRPPKDVLKSGFIYGSPKNVSVGDLVSVDGTVYEFLQTTKPLSLSVTEIVNPIYVTRDSNITVAPILIGIGGLVIPDTVIEDDAFGYISINNSFDPGTDGIDFYESLEGMLVKINDAVVVGPNEPDRITNHAVAYVLTDNDSLASIRTPAGGIILRPGDHNPERIGLDFYASSPEPVNVGDVIRGPIFGAIHYSDYNYRIVVDKNTPLAVTHGESDEQTAEAQNTIAAYNVHDLSYKDLKTKRFRTLARQIVEDLGAPDLIALEEIVGDNSTEDGSDIFKTLNLLTENISIVSNGKLCYRNISIPDKNSSMNMAILYRTDRGLSFKGLSTGNPGENVTLIGGLHLSPNPGWVYPREPVFKERMRKPLAAEFTFNGQSLFVIANHLKSKLGDERLFGEFQPPRTITENQRHKQAQIVHGFVEEILNIDPKANVIVLGDFNDFQFSETLDILKGNLLTNPLENLSIEEQYTYNFIGNSQAIDHILISKNLASMSPEFRVVHINSDFGNQSSDHDPVALRINFVNRSAIAAPAPKPTAGYNSVDSDIAAASKMNEAEVNGSINGQDSDDKHILNLRNGTGGGPNAAQSIPGSLGCR